ncbi:MAG: protein translocase subunit SecD, partial [Mangrovicoccus sp.]|nr:protein translocase subunit SecD [Mangrovicoccus sp.]
MHIELWKRFLIWGVVALGFALAMPNLFYPRVERHNDAVTAIERQGGVATPAQEADAALWPSFLPSGIVNLGLDLRGGAHLLAEVQLDGVYADRMNALWPEVRDALRAERATVGPVQRVDAPPGEIRVKIGNADGAPRAVEVVRDLASPIVSLTGVGASDIEVAATGTILSVKLSEAEKQATDERAIRQSLEIVRRRVDEVGTREPTIQRQGTDRILIQVPGIGSAAELKDLIGTTAKLTFQPVIGRAPEADAQVPADQKVLPSLNEKGVFYIGADRAVVSGEELTDAQPAYDQNGQPAVNFRFNPSGARKFGDYTAAHIGEPFAIVLDGQVISAPVIQSHIAGGSGIITGSFSVEESTQLAVLLRAGALPAEMTFLEERTIGPELGADSIEAGKLASVVALVGLMLFMWLTYGLFGIFANIALLVNLVLIFALLSMLGATLTMPGIAGIVLTMGMAVDANVLVFERIREELRAGRGPARA